MLLKRVIKDSLLVSMYFMALLTTVILMVFFIEIIVYLVINFPNITECVKNAT